MAIPALISGTFGHEVTSRKVFQRLRELHDAALLNLTGLIWIAVAKDGRMEIAGLDTYDVRRSHPPGVTGHILARTHETIRTRGLSVPDGFQCRALPGYGCP
ncbi:hypothetical protein HII28_09490 [Planctomonas sp. JC2975]|uniref:hypothetical protein n=1 Tax=Planctomonas sp. JC2975 TaxID=2729626 RepID=UPI001474ED47|nr:hypothetical protein [Planctomonas sp. JC2975]NNC12109.1 hypothetical protein [Planctomonas sp. JC2975]